MNFRFTLSNPIVGSHVISEPIGWKGIIIKLLRDVDYHSLVETIDTQFTFYNSGQGLDGGREFIVAIESSQGQAAQIKILIDISENGGASYDTVFVGNLDLSSKQDVSRGTIFYEYKCDVIPDDNWAKFINRSETALDLHSINDVDGNAVAQPADIVLQMPSQTLRQAYVTNETVADNTQYLGDLGADRFVPFTLSNELINELNVGIVVFDALGAAPDPIFLAPSDGTYKFDIKINITVIDCGSHDDNLITTFFDAYGAPGNYTGVDPNGLIHEVRFQINDDTPITPFVRAFHGNYNSYEWHSDYLNLKLGDSVRVYLYVKGTGTPSHGTYGFGLLGSDNPNIFYDRDGDKFPNFSGSYETYFNITANTLYPSTTADAMLLYDTADALTKRMGTNGIYSDYMGGTSQGYGVDGCACHFAVNLGLHVRGFQFIEKVFSSNWKQWWEGANPIFNLGCGIENVNGVDKIRIEQKDYFYNDTPSLYFSNVNNITKSYDKSKAYKSISIGYSNWSAESASGIDDVQTSHKYSAPFPLFGTDITLLSSWVAAALAIEQTRRNRRELNKDWRLDNNVMIVALNGDASPEVPEQNTFFTAITGLFNPETRYNIRLSVYRNFQRWIKFFSGCMLSANPFKFEGGEGNYAMTVGANSDTCDPGTWSENQNILPSSLFYYKPDQYAFTAPLTWTDYKTIRNNRKQCVAVSPSADGHVKLHIEELNYSIETAEVTIKGWIKQ